MTKKQREIYTALAQATERALEKGFELRTKQFGDGVTCGCPIMFFAAQKRGTDSSDDAFKIAGDAFKISRDDVWGIIGGFDDSIIADESPEMAVIGQHLRETYYETA